MDGLSSSAGLVQSFSRKSLRDAANRDESTRDDGRRHASTTSTETTLADLEADLKLSAAVGTALLEEKQALQVRLTALEAANDQLVRRLARTAQENTQLSQRLDAALSNLDQAEANNRALLATLETDRKRLSRLSTDSARLLSTAAQLKTSSTAVADARDELAAEHKRTVAAETRADKSAARVKMLETRLHKAIEDLEEIRQDKILRTRKSFTALAQVKASYSKSVSALDQSSGHDNPEAAELLKLVESLVTHNESLRATTSELSEMLDQARNEQTEARAELAGLRDAQTAGTYSGELSPGASLISPRRTSSRPSDTAGSSQPLTSTRSWAPPSTLLSLRTNSSGLAEETGVEDPSRRAASLRRTEMILTGGSRAGGIVPIGARRRPSSMYLDNIRRPSNEYGGLISPLSDTQSVFASTPSAMSDDEGRIRHPRPLSLSTGPSLFPTLALSDDNKSTTQYASARLRASHSPTTIVASEPSRFEDPPPTSRFAPSGLSLSSPTKTRGDGVPFATTDEDTVEALLFSATVEAAIPTFDYHPTLRRATSSANSTPRRSLEHHNLSQTTSTSYRASSTTSEGSERDKALLDFGITPLVVAGGPDQRSAALSKLMEHVTKIIGRLQSADIASQEKRLKKQRLAGGDVRHLAEANLKEVVHDIEGLRPHFRRVLELERASTAREPASVMSNASLQDSLIVRRDFVNLVKLFRDLLFETSRLRFIVNRVQLDPTLATDMRALDVENILQAEPSVQQPASTSAGGGGLVARLLSVGGAPGPEAEHHSLRRSVTNRSSMRPIGLVSSATINVAFESGVGRAVEASEGPASVAGGSLSATAVLPAQSARRKVGAKSKRELNSIFAGALPLKAPASSTTSAHPVPTRVSLNPFSRLLAYRPALSATTNAILDSFQHSPLSSGDQAPVPNLLERQLRPRGLSDSSIRSTFVAHANPHHRIISPATLALSSEVSTAGAIPILYQNLDQDSSQQLMSDLRTGTTPASGSLGRKASAGILRSRPSIVQLRASSPAPQDIPPVPALPVSLPAPISISLSISPSRQQKPSPTVIPTHPGPLDTALASSLAQTGGGGGGGMFESLSSWASMATALSPLARAVQAEDGAGLVVDRSQSKSRLSQVQDRR